MAKKYIGDIVQTDVFKVKTNKPLDDRLVVTTRASLMEASTWQVVQGGDVKLYSGIVVNVVNDTEANNGLYSLRNWSKYDKQAWDSTDAQTYDADGWKKMSAADKQEVYWCYWDDDNSTVTGLTPAQIYQLTQDGCIVKCKFVDGADEFIFDLWVILHSEDTEYGDFYQISFVNNTIRSSYISTEKISYSSYSGWQIENIMYQPDWNQTDTTASDYIKNKPTVPTVRTMNHEQLTDSSLGDINIHDGYYFPNAAQDADGNWYGAVVIGDQVWMAENLRCTKLPNGTAITNGSPSANGGNLNYSLTQPRYYIPNDDETLVPKIGLAYNGKALLNGDTTSDTVPSGIQGIAPSGWHIPSMGEYDKLLGYVISQKRYLSAAPYDEQDPDSHYYNTNSLSSNDVWYINSNNNTSYYAEGDIDKINATGFNWRIEPTTGNWSGFGYILATTKYNSRNSDLQPIMESISGCNCLSGVEINTDDGHNFEDSIQFGQYGIPVRCVSDLSPVQFRNWYVETYGTMQHHLLPTYTYYSHICTNASEPLIMSCPDNEITHHDIGIDPNLSTAPSITINLCNTNDNCFTFMQGFTPSYYPVTLQYKGTAINQVVNFGGNSMGIFKDTNDDLYLYTKGRSMVFKLRVVTASTPYVLIESGEIDSTILNSNS